MCVCVGGGLLQSKAILSKCVEGKQPPGGETAQDGTYSSLKEAFARLWNIYGEGRGGEGEGEGGEGGEGREGREGGEGVEPRTLRYERGIYYQSMNDISQRIILTSLMDSFPFKCCR